MFKIMVLIWVNHFERLNKNFKIRVFKSLKACETVSHAIIS